MTSDNLFVKENDLKLFWEALWKGLDNDHSAIRHIRPRGVYVFTHCSPRGNAPSHRLFDMLKIALKEDVKKEDRSPSQFSDYKITLPEESLKIGEDEVKIIHADAEELKNKEGNKEILGNTVVFTKVYHE
jgi:CRISPR-associated protein Csd2